VYLPYLPALRSPRRRDLSSVVTQVFMFFLSLARYLLELPHTTSSVAVIRAETAETLILSLLMSYIYMELLVKQEILTSYIYGPAFGNAESRLFVSAAQCFNTESMQKVFLCHSCV
jgi:hypothetical protein